MADFSMFTLAAFVVAANEIVKIIANAIGGETGVEKIKRFIPLFSLAFGVILAIIGFFMPDVDMGKNVVEAVFIGFASGASATGYHQVVKQLQKPSDTDDNYDDELYEDADDEDDVNVPTHDNEEHLELMDATIRFLSDDDANEQIDENGEVD